jgi:hypothetical protein
VLFVLAIVAGSIPPGTAPVAFAIALGVFIVVGAAAIVWMLVVAARGRGNPDADGNLRSLDGLVLVDSPQSAAHRTPVYDVGRHQSAIEAALAFGDATPRAVLVPGASRLLGLTLRVGVELVVGDRVFHVGFLEERTGVVWSEALVPLRHAGRYVSAPARIRGDGRPYAVDLDLGGVHGAIAAAA